MDLDNLPQLELPWAKPSNDRRKKKNKRQQRAAEDDNTMRYVAYGAAMLTGAILLRSLRRRLSRLPVIGMVAAPMMALIPCSLIGAAAGAAVVYSIEEGDAGAVRHKLLPSVRRSVVRARDEVVAVAADVRQDAERLAREHERAMKALQREGHRLAPALEGAAAEAERSLLPGVRREFDRGRREVERSLRELEAAATGGASDGHHSHHHGARRRHQDQSNRALVRRFAAAADSGSE